MDHLNIVAPPIFLYRYDSLGKGNIFRLGTGYFSKKLKKVWLYGHPSGCGIDGVWGIMMLYGIYVIFIYYVQYDSSVGE